MHEPYTKATEMKYYKVIFSIDAPEELLADVRDLLADAAGEAGFESFEETVEGMNGYVQTSLLDRNALEQAVSDFPISGVGITYTVTDAEDKDWNEEWESRGFEPITVGGGCVIHDGRHLPSQLAETSVEIDARQAFGTGSHETTRMMAAALMEEQPHGKVILDAGCGTGILGILALKLGARQVTGYDIDEWSVDNARHNAIINRVENGYTALLGDVSAIDDTAQRFDIVAANINRNILLADMKRWAGVMKSGGALLTSGFYTEDKPMLEECAKSLGLVKTAEKEDNNWACMTFKLTV